MKPPPGDKLDQMIDPLYTRRWVSMGIEADIQSRGLGTATREINMGDFDLGSLGVSAQRLAVALSAATPRPNYRACGVSASFRHADPVLKACCQSNPARPESAHPIQLHLLNVDFHCPPLGHHHRDEAAKKLS